MSIKTDNTNTIIQGENMDFDTLKSSSSNFDKLTKALEQNLKPEDQANKNKYQDDRLWKIEMDKTGNGYAVIRFLPASNGEDMPWQRVWSHAFQDKGGWYIENSLTTLGNKDPVSEENTRLWNTGVESDKEIAKKENESYLTMQMFWSLVTLKIHKMKVELLYLNLVRKSLIRLLKQCNQHLKMKHQSTHLISGKVQTLN